MRRIDCTLLFVYKMSSKLCLSSLCQTRSCCFAVQLRGALALGGPLASLGLLVLWCGGPPGVVQHSSWDWYWVHVLGGRNIAGLE